MKIKGIKVKGYKSFSENYIEIDHFENINVFIGRNNSGKSSCLDLIECLCSANELENKTLGKEIDYQIECELTEADIRSVFRESAYAGGINARNHYEFGKAYIGKHMRFNIDTISSNIFSGEKNYNYQYRYIPDDDIFSNKYIRYWNEFSQCKVEGFNGYKIRRIDAERNVIPEVETDLELLSSTGDGASNIVRKFLNYSQYDENIIQKKLLVELNKIIEPDAKFNNIKVQQIEQDATVKWEIFLEEDGSRYALSKMGSGLKTIILVLLNLFVITQTKEYKSKEIIYAFEELENNLHPALQRRLFEYLYNYSIENNDKFFITTHSHVAINAFADKENTQIFHVKKENGVSTLHKIDNYISKSDLLNDLDVKASDLLQSNGIIWVEGPSDKIYIKRWLEIFGKNEWKEGRDYQFQYYGGRMLYHYTADVEKEDSDLINILLMNRNAAIVMDSDKRYTNAPINDTKKRVRDEFEKHNAFCWITKGKEIENYLPKCAIEDTYGIKLESQCAQYSLFPEYIKEVKNTFNKVKFAHEVSEHITEENSKDMYDLRTQIIHLCSCIEQWNK
ncbi:MAG: ATP-binding protein [Lachnospiraceae bacterium]|nr:ATP-binding protein [Lachnospiraceae bacterium]